MKIDSISNALYVGNFKLRSPDDKSRNLIKIEWVVSADIKKNIESRVYIFTSNDEIMKIGGSGDKSGLVGTLGFYANGLTGNPGIRAFVCHHLIHRELVKGNQVKAYAIFTPGIEHEVVTLNGSKKTKIYSFFREIENACIEEYMNMEKSGVQPPWNFQEGKKGYPKDLQLEYNKLKNTKSSINKITSKVENK